MNADSSLLQKDGKESRTIEEPAVILLQQLATVPLMSRDTKTVECR